MDPGLLSYFGFTVSGLAFGLFFVLRKLDRILENLKEVQDKLLVMESSLNFTRTVVLVMAAANKPIPSDVEA